MYIVGKVLFNNKQNIVNYALFIYKSNDIKKAGKVFFYETIKEFSKESINSNYQMSSNIYLYEVEDNLRSLNMIVIHESNCERCTFDIDCITSI